MKKLIISLETGSLLVKVTSVISFTFSVSVCADKVELAKSPTKNNPFILIFLNVKQIEQKDACAKNTSKMVP